MEVKTSGLHNHVYYGSGIYTTASDAAKADLWLSRLAVTFQADGPELDYGGLSVPLCPGMHTAQKVKLEENLCD